MTDYETELLLWEQSQREKDMARIYTAKGKPVCPRKEALRDYRHHHGTRHWSSKDGKLITTQLERAYRRRQKQLLRRGETLRPVPHDYHTYGWIRW